MRVLLSRGALQLDTWVFVTRVRLVQSAQLSRGQARAFSLTTDRSGLSD